MTDTLPRVRPYELPEYLTTRDTGCEHSPSCLDCPLDVCKHDADPPTFTGKDERDDHIFALRKKGMSITLLARTYGISWRSVARIIQHGGAVKQHRSPKVPNNGARVAATDLRTHNFTERPTQRPRRAHRAESAVYPRSCAHCGGSVEIRFSTKEAACLSCARDPRNKKEEHSDH